MISLGCRKWVAMSAYKYIFGLEMDVFRVVYGLYPHLMRLKECVSICLTGILCQMCFVTGLGVVNTNL